MRDCELCKNFTLSPMSDVCRNCGIAMLNFEKRSLTNADKIRSMSDEELAELFANDNCCYCRIHDFCFDNGCAINCEDVWLDWLRQEAET